MKTIFSTGEAARLLGVKPYRIEYALATGQIPEPNRVFGKRAYQWSELLALAEHFEVKIKTLAPTGPEMETK